MKIELDHFFILVEPGAKVADRLLELGIMESFSRVHKGQGTTNRCFSFSNSTLELLWVHNEQEANNGPASNLNFTQRSKDPKASPFGVVLYRKNKEDRDKPFPGWTYQPDYFDPPWAFHVGENSSRLEEPLCIYVPFFDPVERKTETGRFRTVNRIGVHTPATPLSATLNACNDADRLEIRSGLEHLMEIWFENSEGGHYDLRPELPLIIHG